MILESSGRCNKSTNRLAQNLEIATMLLSAMSTALSAHYIYTGKDHIQGCKSLFAAHKPQRTAATFPKSYMRKL
jgi:hypothetical protein